MLRVKCPRCETLLEIKTELRREEITCPECELLFIALADEVTRQPDRIRLRANMNADICSILGLVTSIVGSMVFLCAPVGVVVAAIGLTLSIYGLRSQFRGSAVVGVVFGSVALIYSVGVMFVFGTAFVVSLDEIHKRNNVPAGPPQPRFRVK